MYPQFSDDLDGGSFSSAQTAPPSYFRLSTNVQVRAKTARGASISTKNRFILRRSQHDRTSSSLLVAAELLLQRRSRPDPVCFSGGVERDIAIALLFEMDPRALRFAERGLRTIRRGLPDHSRFTPMNFTTLPHFSVSSAMSLPKSAAEPGRAVPPSSASRALILGSARPALISLLSVSMIPAGVFLGAPRPVIPLAS